MKQEEINQLNELRAKEQLDEKEYAQWRFLENKLVTDERVKQFRKNQGEPYGSKRSRAVNLAWEFYRQSGRMPMGLFPRGAWLYSKMGIAPIPCSAI